MIDTNSTSQSKLIETFTKTSLIVSHHLINYLIFNSFLFQKLAGSHKTISSHISKSYMFSFVKFILLRFSNLFLPEPEKFLARLELIIRLSNLILFELSKLMLVNRRPKSFGNFK